MEHYTQLSQSERNQIQTFNEMNVSISEIARRLFRHRSTIHRELNRNSNNNNNYFAIAAHKKSLRRKQRKCYIQRNLTLKRYVIEKLKAYWSPEQIVGRLKRKKSKYVICHETIYRYIYKHNHDLHQYLPYRKRKRRKPYSRKSTCRYGKKRLIIERPKYIEKRWHIGHWEGDSIEFKGSTKCTITTLVERKTRLVLLIKNLTKHTTNVMKDLSDKLSSIGESICKSITFDQGVEFANFRQIESSHNCKVYYCHIHSPWEKGSNENMNGRLRKVLPKDASIEDITQEELDEIARLFNATPRKCLDYRSPKELFLKSFKSTCCTSL